MSSRLLIILADPDPESVCNTLGRTYGLAAQAHGASVHYLNLNRLNLLAKAGLPEANTSLIEPDLAAAQEFIQWADHTVWAYPHASGGLPAQLKAFVERIFVPGFAYVGSPGTSGLQPLLLGKSADVLVTVETVPWYNCFNPETAATRELKQSVLAQCGMGPVRNFTFGPVRDVTAQRRSKWMAQVVELATAGLGQTALETEPSHEMAEADGSLFPQTPARAFTTIVGRTKPVDFPALSSSHVHASLSQ